MKVQYVTGNGRLTFEFESENDKTLVTNLAHIQEVFEVHACGCCKSDRIRFDVRDFDGNHYYKLLCDACGATLDFGQHKTGNTLFVKRFEKDTREPLRNGGWYHYRAPDEAPAKPTSAPKAEAAPSTNRATKPGAPKRLTTDLANRMIVAGFDGANTQAVINEWVAWAKQFEFEGLHQDEQSDAYHLALERIARDAKAAPSNRRTMQRTA